MPSGTVKDAEYYMRHIFELGVEFKVRKNGKGHTGYTVSFPETVIDNCFYSSLDGVFTDLYYLF